MEIFNNFSLSFVFYFFSFIFGLSIGSFLNVLIDRLPQDKKITGWSKCDHCHHRLFWYDLIPIVSFLFLRGKCRYCHKKISWQYPLVEIITGFLYLLIFNFQFPISNKFSIFNFQFLKLISEWGIASCLIVVFFSDVKYHLISDYILWAFFGFSFIYRIVYTISAKVEILSEILKQVQNDIFFSLFSSLIVALPIFLIYYISRERAMGLGDVYLSAIIGFFLGWQKGFLALYFAFILGGLVGLFLILLGRKKLKSKIAFGPFLVLGVLIMWFFGEGILSFIFKLFL